MRPRDVPFVGSIDRAGAGDPVFGWLMVVGPAVFAVVALLGRSPLTMALVGLYVAAFVVYVPYKALRLREERRRAGVPSREP